jgi:hypothetical protein
MFYALVNVGFLSGFFVGSKDLVRLASPIFCLQTTL